MTPASNRSATSSAYVHTLAMFVVHAQWRLAIKKLGAPWGQRKYRGKNRGVYKEQLLLHQVYLQEFHKMLFTTVSNSSYK